MWSYERILVDWVLWPNLHQTRTNQTVEMNAWWEQASVCVRKIESIVQRIGSVMSVRNLFWAIWIIYIFGRACELLFVHCQPFCAHCLKKTIQIPFNEHDFVIFPKHWQATIYDMNKVWTKLKDINAQYDICRLATSIKWLLYGNKSNTNLMDVQLEQKNNDATKEKQRQRTRFSH